jgi:preprotein translocase subunit SecG
VHFLLYTIHALVCIFLILVVLLQQGKGADLSVFGGGSTQTAFGARGATTFLHKLTVASFVIFVLTTLAIGILSQGGASSVMRHATSNATPIGSKSTPVKAATPAPVTPAPTRAIPAPAAATPATATPVTATPAPAAATPPAAPVSKPPAR